MNKPTYNLGDLIDRLSILTMKIYFGDEQSISEHRYLEQGLEGYGIDGKIITNSIRLALMNRLTWEQEHDSRKDMRDESDLSEEELVRLGRINVRVRNFNRKRIEYKNILNDLQKDGERFKENKVLHRSEPV